MNETMQRVDTALLGPTRAVSAALGQHARTLGLIQIEAGSAYLDMTLQRWRSLDASLQGGSDWRDGIEQQALTATAVSERVNNDTQRVLQAQYALQSTLGILTSDSVASMQSVATEAADRLNAISY
jgi:hypothetical protein